MATADNPMIAEAYNVVCIGANGYSTCNVQPVLSIGVLEK